MIRRNLCSGALSLLVVTLSPAAFAQPATVLDQFIGCSLYSDEQPPKFLGTISRSTSGNSIRNIYGSYGSAYSSTSIRNSYSNYGSPYSQVSAYNSYAVRPPRIVNQSNIIVGFLTKNRTINGNLDPDFLLIGLDVLDDWSYHSQFFSTASFQHLIQANDGTRLGFTYPDRFNALSIINETGQYGSATSSTSIYNSYSSYGSSFGAQSAYNAYASTPPVIYRKNLATGFVTALAYLTKNTFKTPYEDPDELRVALLLAALPATPQPPPKLSQTITFAQPVNQMFSLNRTFALSASASSGLQVSFTSSNPNVLSVSGNTATIKAAGPVNITASHGGNANYNPAPSVARTITVTKGAQSIRPFAPANNVRFGAVVTFTNTNSTARLPVAFERVSGPVTVSGNRATVTGVGTAVVRAIQNGNTNYSAAVPLTNRFTTVKAGQTITWTNLPGTNNFVTDRLIPLGARSSSGLPVTYTSARTNVLQIVGTSAVIKGRGTNTITARQPGNTNYHAASNVVRTIVIK